MQVHAVRLSQTLPDLPRPTTDSRCPPPQMQQGKEPSILPGLMWCLGQVLHALGSSKTQVLPAPLHLLSQAILQCH